MAALPLSCVYMVWMGEWEAGSEKVEKHYICAVNIAYYRYVPVCSSRQGCTWYVTM